MYDHADGKDAPDPGSANHAMFRRSSVRVAGGEFSCLIAGDRSLPLVLCLHGFPDYPPTLRPFMARLMAAGYRVAAPWLRGYWPSVLSGPHDLDRLGRDVVELARALSPGRPVFLVGHDWGAAAAYEATTMAPELFVAAATLAVPHPLAFFRNLPRQPAQLRRSWYMFFFQLPGVAELVVARGDASGNLAFIDRLWRAWSPGYRLPEHHRRQLHACLAASMPAPIAYYRALLRPLGKTLDRFRTQSALTITVPVLHLHGSRDGCIGADLGRGQERYFQGPFESASIPGVGHFLHIEEPALVAEQVVSWFDRFAGQASHT